MTTEAHTEVFTSSCERRNSGLTRPSVSAMQRCSSSAGRIGNEVARGEIHEQIFFFYPQRETLAQRSPASA